jgi:hypothetical protein
MKKNSNRRFEGQNKLKVFILFGNVSKIFCASFALNFESLEPLFEKLAYKDNTHSGHITRLLTD